MAKKLTFTHPRTGKTYTRTTDADYSVVSIKNGEAKFHFTPEAARRRGGEVFPLSQQFDTPAQPQERPGIRCPICKELIPREIKGSEHMKTHQ